jgi:hypothetical protein
MHPVMPPGKHLLNFRRYFTALTRAGGALLSRFAPLSGLAFHSGIERQ